MSFDLLPWESAPQAPQARLHTIEWREGRLTIPALGYLTTDELALIAQVDPQNALYRLTADAAVALHRATDRSPRLCFALLTALHGRDLGAAVTLAPEDEELQVSQAPIIGPFLEQARAIANRVTIRSVTVILRRIKPDWSDERTGKLPPDLLRDLHAFEQEEERAGMGEQADPEADMRQLEEALGKLQQVVGSIATDPTGDAPSGSAAASGPPPPSSAASGSARSRASTSSRRSRKASEWSVSGFTAKS